MLRTLAFGAIAAIAGRQLYKSGALHRFSDDARRRLEESGLMRNDRATSSTSAYAGATPAGAATGPTI